MAEAALGAGRSRDPPPLPPAAGPAQTVVLRRGMTPTGLALAAADVYGYPQLTAPAVGAAPAVMYDPGLLYDRRRAELRATAKYGINYQLLRSLDTIRAPALPPEPVKPPPPGTPFFTLDGGKTFCRQTRPRAPLSPPAPRVRRYGELVGAAALAAYAEPPSRPGREAGAPLLETWEKARAVPPPPSGMRTKQLAAALETAWAARDAAAADDAAALAPAFARFRPPAPTELQTTAVLPYAEYRLAELLQLERDAEEAARARRQAASFEAQAARGALLSPLGLYAYAAVALERTAGDAAVF